MATPALRSVVEDIVVSVGFFTRLPIGSLPQRRLADAIWAAPVAGLLVGLAGALALLLLEEVGLPPTIGAIGALAATMLATGALHEDGLADVADGFGGGATPERKLEIMKDSRIGAYGVAALVLGILTRWAAITALPAPWTACACLVGAHAASRGLLPSFMAAVRPARAQGLSAGVGSVDSATGIGAAFIGAVSLLPLGLGAALLAAILLAAWWFALKALCERQIGGQTGDVLGALQQGGEIIVLLSVLALQA